MSKSLRSIKDLAERDATVRRRIREHKGEYGVGGLGYLAAVDYSKKQVNTIMVRR